MSFISLSYKDANITTNDECISFCNSKPYNLKYNTFDENKNICNCFANPLRTKGNLHNQKAGMKSHSIQ